MKRRRSKQLFARHPGVTLREDTQISALLALQKLCWPKGADLHSPPVFLSSETKLQPAAGDSPSAKMVQVAQLSWVMLMASVPCQSFCGGRRCLNCCMLACVRNSSEEQWENSKILCLFPWEKWEFETASPLNNAWISCPFRYGSEKACMFPLQPRFMCISTLNAQVVLRLLLVLILHALVTYPRGTLLHRWLLWSTPLNVGAMH